MSIYENLPGVILDLKDGNLSILPEDNTPKVLILGTATQGDAREIFRVGRSRIAESQYGLEGSLIRGMYEAYQGKGANVYLFRIGAKPAFLHHIGDSTGVGGITIETYAKDNTAGANIKIFWDDSASLLKCWDEQDTLVYDSSVGLDTGKVIVSGTAIGVSGADIGTALAPVAIKDVVAAGTSYIAGDDGVAPTQMELYEALNDAYRLLEAWDMDYIVPMDAHLDALNIADDQTFISTATNEAVGTGNGILTAFDLDHTRVVPSTLVVEVDNAPITDYRFSAGTGTNGVDQLIISALEREVANEAVGTGTIGGKTDFDLLNAGVIEDTLEVTVDGSPVTAFTLSKGTGVGDVDQIVFAVAPDNGDAVVASYTWAGPLKAGEALAASYSYITKDALLYLRTYEADGDIAYEWHTAKTRSVGETTYSYHEVNFAHQLATFCHEHSVNEDMVMGAIGMRAPLSNTKKDIDAWIGTSPTRDIDGVVTVNGTGLLGNKFMAGHTNFSRGFWYCPSGWLDEGVVNDVTLNADIGRYLSVVATWGVFFNQYGGTYGYLGNIAAMYAGMVSVLPSNQAPTNKVIGSVLLKYRLTKTKQNDLVGAKYIVVASRDAGNVVLDGVTAATPNSDYQRLTTIKIVTEWINRCRKLLSTFIGNSSTGLTRVGMETALEKLGTEMMNEGKLQAVPRVYVTATAAQQIQGNATVEAVLVPAFELRKINVVVALSAI